MRSPCVAMLAIALGLSGCASTESFGVPASGFVVPSLASAYMPLQHSSFFGTGDGAAVVIAPGIAVTNAHNANLVDSAAVIGKSPDFDLMFFRTRNSAAPRMSAPMNGEAVIAYGQGSNGDLREVHGVVRVADGEQHGLIYEANAGPGFSGGPVVDARTGNLLGITFGYDDDSATKKRLMYAYDMTRVLIELRRVTPAAPRNNR